MAETDPLQILILQWHQYAFVDVEEGNVVLGNSRVRPLTFSCGKEQLPWSDNYPPSTSGLFLSVHLVNTLCLWSILSIPQWQEKDVW